MKLLPCPFCGGEPEEDGGMFFEFYGHERQDYSIACKKCRAEVRCDVGEHEGADAPCSCHHDTRKICAEKWNRRAAMLQGADGNSPVIPDGWVLVPIDPTPDMREAYHQAQAEYEDVDGLWSPDHQWQAMHAAAPEFREIVNSSTNNCRENAETSTKCWCHTCRPVTFADSHFVVCPDCGNKRCPHANDHRHACTGSNEPGQEGSAYTAAPQQEVKP